MSRPTIDRSPPVNIEAEQGVLGSILLDNTVADDVFQVVRGDDFFRDTHQVIFGVIRGLIDSGKPADYVTVADELERLGLFAKIGGDDAMSEIIESVPHAANAKYYAGIVREKAIGRRLIDAATEILKRCYAGDMPADALVAAAEERIMAVGDRDHIADLQEMRTIVDDTMTRKQERAAGQLFGIRSGFQELDQLTGGFKPAHLIVLAARPSMGKTAIALDFALRAAESTPVLFVSVEMGPQSLGDRIISSQARIDSYRFERPWKLSGDENRDICNTANRLSPLPLVVDFTPNRTVGDITSTARRMKRRGGLGLVLVDYIGLIDGGERPKGDGREREVARISAGLKGISKSLDIPVIILAQLNRQCEMRTNKQPILSDLRESGSIEQDADVVMFLHRPEYYNPNDRPGLAELVVAKNRNGATGIVPLRFTKAHARFDSLDDCQDTPADGPAF